QPGYEELRQSSWARDPSSLIAHNRAAEKPERFTPTPVVDARPMGAVAAETAFRGYVFLGTATAAAVAIWLRT
ncbi:hypothetical protein, partial [Streptomyces sp. NRRL F-2747]|uniref:hypothetical protein n=1 Tax=Streptomyces sp. NRRL F-2747 TaxID=1463843 RepID=UPI001F221AFA